MKKTTQLAGYKATVSRVRTLLLRERVVSGTLNVHCRELKSLMLEMSEWTRRLLAEEIAATTGRGAGTRENSGKGAAGAGRKAAGRPGRRKSRSAG